MDIKRYIVVQAVQTRDKTLIPVWDERVVFNKTENFGNQIHIEGSRMDKTYSVVECIFDLKTKKLEMGLELNYYPEISSLSFKKGESIYFEKSHRTISEAIISDIIFEDFDLSIKRGKNIDNYYKNRFKDINIDNEQLYAIKSWKPTYLLDDGTKIEYHHQLFKKA